MIKIQREIVKLDKISDDSLFGVLEYCFAGRYKLSKITKSIFRLKRLYRFQSNGRETIVKQLDYRDSSIIENQNDSVIYKLDLTKQIITTLICMIIGFFILWRGFKITPAITLIIVLIPVIIIWINVIIVSIRFASEMSKQIAKLIDYKD